MVVGSPYETSSQCAQAVLNSNDQIQASTLAVCSEHFQQHGDMARWDVQWWLAWHLCFWIEIRLVVINPGSVTETWLPDMLATTAVPDIQVAGRLEIESMTLRGSKAAILSSKIEDGNLC